MNKLFKRYFLVWLISYIIFNAVCIFVPNDALEGYEKYGGAFWGAFAFIDIAFLGQLFCAYKAFNAKNATRLFYNIPLVTISYAGLVVSLVAGIICMVIPDLPNWIAIIVAVIVLAFTAASLIKADTAAELVESKDNEIKAKTSFIKNLTAEAETLMAEAGTHEEKMRCKSIYETLRYSDPMSSDALLEAEENIKSAFAAFAAEKSQGNADKLLSAIRARNTKCKALK